MSTRVPTALCRTLGNEATFELVELMAAERDDWSADAVDRATDRFERRLTEEVSGLKLEFRHELHDGLTAVRQELAKTRVEWLKWSFLFWIGQLTAIAGLLALLRGPR